MKKIAILCPGHNYHLLCTAITAALSDRHMIGVHNSNSIPYLGRKPLRETYTITDISIREIGIVPYYEDKAPSGMSQSYHHILSKQRKKKGDKS